MRTGVPCWPARALKPDFNRPAGKLLRDCVTRQPGEVLRAIFRGGAILDQGIARATQLLHLVADGASAMGRTGGSSATPKRASMAAPALPVFAACRPLRRSAGLDKD
jgi:hypothetical protein